MSNKDIPLNLIGEKENFEAAWSLRPEGKPVDSVDGINLKELAWLGWQMRATNPPRLSSSILSTRETEILILMAKGCSMKETARLLEITYHTVNDYIKTIYKKLGVDTKAEASVWAAKKGLV